MTRGAVGRGRNGPQPAAPVAPSPGPRPRIGETNRPNRPTTSVVYAANTRILAGCASDGWSCAGRRMVWIIGRRAPRQFANRLRGVPGEIRADRWATRLALAA